MALGTAASLICLALELSKILKYLTDEKSAFKSEHEELKGTIDNFSLRFQQIFRKSKSQAFVNKGTKLLEEAMTVVKESEEVSSWNLYGWWSHGKKLRHINEQISIFIRVDIALESALMITEIRGMVETGWWVMCTVVAAAPCAAIYSWVKGSQGPEEKQSATV